MLSDELTDKEFKQYVRMNYRGWAVKDLSLKPMNDIPAKDGKPTQFFMVKGIQDERYSRLNGTVVEGYTANRLPQPVLAEYSHTPLRNKEGRVRYEYSDRPANSMPVLSKQNLILPYGYTPTEPGLKYSMHFETGQYGYYLPEKYLYKINLTALVISGRNNVKSYYGQSLLTFEMGTIFIGVVPFSGRVDYVNTVVLGVEPDDNWEKEIQLLPGALVGMGVIPVPGALDGCETPVSNLDMQYRRVEELSVGDQKLAAKVPELKGSEALFQ